MDFKGKVVLITGASSGIGAETALYFSRLGASLSLIGRNADNLNDVVQKCSENGTVAPLAIIADVTKDASNIINKTIEHFGQLDVLINNAGRGAAGTIETTTLEQYDEMMNLNVRSVYELTMLAAPHLIKTKGNIVNVSSVAGLRAFPNFLAYCMSKSALNQFTQCVALELAPKGVRVNAVNPAVIRSNFHYNAGMSDEAYKAYLESCKATHALGRVGNANEVAAGIAFLASDAATFITGTLLPIDGGKAIMCPR